MTTQLSEWLLFLFSHYVDASIELEIKDTTDTARCTSYLDLHLEISSEDRFSTKVYDKRYYFNFPIGTFHSYVATFQQHLHMEYISVS